MLEARPQPSLFTRLRAVEAELQIMKVELADLKVDHDALRDDRDEWRWRAERLLAERKERLLDRWEARIAKVVKLSVSRLNGALQTRRPEVGGASSRKAGSDQPPRAQRAEG